jgi:hypothetical protein
VLYTIILIPITVTVQLRFVGVLSQMLASIFTHFALMARIIRIKPFREKVR